MTFMPNVIDNTLQMKEKYVLIEGRYLKSFACPCCGYFTLGERGGWNICDYCGREDDGQDDNEKDEVRGGPNGDDSITSARTTFLQSHINPFPGKSVTLPDYDGLQYLQEDILACPTISNDIQLFAQNHGNNDYIYSEAEQRIAEFYVHDTKYFGTFPLYPEVPELKNKEFNEGWEKCKCCQYNSISPINTNKICSVCYLDNNRYYQQESLELAQTMYKFCGIGSLDRLRKKP